MTTDFINLLISWTIMFTRTVYDGTPTKPVGILLYAQQVENRFAMDLPVTGRPFVEDQDWEAIKRIHGYRYHGKDQK